MIIAVDLDDTLCKGTLPWPEDFNQKKITKFFETCSPIPEAIAKVNELFNKGHDIWIWTSRFSIDYYITVFWLEKHGVKYHKLILDKPKVDIYIDNQSATMEEVLKDDPTFFRRIRFVGGLSLPKQT